MLNTALVLTTLTLIADPLAPRPNGPLPVPPTRVLIDNATVHVAPGKTLDKADVLIENGRIVQVAGTIEPGAARVVDATGRHVYAGFIDAYVPVDAPAPGEHAPGAHWNAFVTPQRDALAGDGLPGRDAEKLRELGFAAAGIAPSSGIFRGWGAVVSTAEPFNDPSLGRPPVYRAHTAQYLALETSRWGQDAYPDSKMGSVALIRQTFLDAQWRADQKDHADANCLDAIDPDALMVYDSGWELEALLGDKIAREFGHKNVAILGSGSEYKRLDALADAKRPVIAPLVFPAAPDVWSVGAADDTTLEELLAWEHAPSNARYLSERGLQVSITSSKLPKSQKFWSNMDKALDAGLAPDAALAMLTTNPASLLGVSDRLGTVEAGKIANLVIASGPLFDEEGYDDDDDAEILDVYIDGRPHHINDAEDTRFDGRWTLGVVGADFTMTISVDGEKVHAKEGDAENDARKVSIKGDRISFLIDDEDDGSGTYLLSGVLSPDGVIRGSGVGPDQSAFEWTGSRAEPDADKPVPSDDFAKGDPANPTDDADKDDDGDDEDETPTTAPVGAPFGAYNLAERPEQKVYLLTNATVWTQADKGVLENGWVLIRDGKIAQLGAGSPPKGEAEVIDCQGKHVTPGLIDCHSHTGLFRLGVNESGQAVTAEVRIGDSLDPGHVGFYRELAGGVTVANLLHGSANPIGGQSQTVKLRWGAERPEDMYFEGAKPGIKFALGENVKQSNWGDDAVNRYPQTRLGVEALIRDRFIKAREYANEWRAWMDRNGKRIIDGNEPPPRDLELETLAEILAGERLVHCHSYRQDEILMLCRVAQDFGFKIGTFQHGLETYKVAELVREHAIGASIFSDWWAYKVEVQDAIPYAGPIDFEEGVVTSYNSDSDDLARHLNVEAAKALKYAKASGIKMTPQDALDFVTRNPAIQLGIADRVGTIEPGKDADLAVWSGNPLSSMTRCERTFVDGREAFSLEQDKAMRDRMQSERARLIAKIMAEGKPKKDAKDDEKEDETDKGDAEPPTRRSLLARAYERALADHIEYGPQPGECGCHQIARDLLQLDQ